MLSTQVDFQKLLAVADSGTGGRGRPPEKDAAFRTCFIQRGRLTYYNTMFLACNVHSLALICILEGQMLRVRGK